jgi:hypothetical protein
MLGRKLSAFATACLAALTVAIAGAGAQTPPPNIPAPSHEPATGLSFPPEIAGARLAYSADYAKTMSRPDLGYAWNYQIAQRLFVTIYVYPAKSGRVPDGATDDLVLAQFQQALGDIYEGAKRGRYDDLKPVDAPGKCTIGGLAFLCVTLSALQPKTREPVHTALMVTGYRGQFLKMRLDWIDTPDNSRASVDRFLQTVIETIRK